MRNSARKHTRNTAIKSRLKNAEKGYLELVTAGKNDEATAALRQVTSFYDKAAKVGVVHSRTADRKKSRLALRLKKAQPPASK